MREILFRGKDCNTGEWLYFGLFDTDMHYVEHNTIGQYTGLQDCTGAMRIYEGDILRDYTGEKVKVVWNDGAYWTTGGSLDEPLTETLAQGCKVIGNVYDGVKG